MFDRIMLNDLLGFDINSKIDVIIAFIAFDFNKYDIYQIIMRCVNSELDESPTSIKIKHSMLRMF